MKRFWLANNNLQHHSAATLPVANQRNYSSTFFQSLLIVLALLFTVNIYAQTATEEQKLAEYKKTVTERVTKIVNTLDINDSGKYQEVIIVVANQYFKVNDIHEESKTATAEIKTNSLVKEETEAALKVQEEKRSAKLLQQHGVFVAQLNKLLSEQQIEKVKDAMTYRVLPITYAAYQDMLPNLSTEQKEKIYNWLKEARELAMDAESADKKHAVFGKYKGRINNYLSAAGIDMKKEGEEWQKRIKEREAKAKEQKGS